MAGEKSFNCQKCGQCCEGRGGIVLSSHDVARLAAFLGRDRESLLEDFAECANGKIRLKSTAEGFCVFFRKGAGCQVHAGKPDICRAWPWFRGNLEDEASFNMAREFCPGISRNVSHAEFVTDGKRYLQEHDILARREGNEANSLLPASSEL